MQNCMTKLLSTNLWNTKAQDHSIMLSLRALFPMLIMLNHSVGLYLIASDLVLPGIIY